MKRKIIETGDGSKTIKILDWNEQYHSVHGAISEARHVYIDAGLNYVLNNNVGQNLFNVLEIGLGTGLNVLLTFIYLEKLEIEVNYIGVEAYPVEEEEYLNLNYPELLGDYKDMFLQIHQIPWSIPKRITDNFSLEKVQLLFSDITYENKFDLIYFDAFGPRVQPELWTEEIFKKMYSSLAPGGVLVTYSSKGDVRRAMMASGFNVKKIPGPPGKREMVRALKLP